jgi:hypothetical protein
MMVVTQHIVGGRYTAPCLREMRDARGSSDSLGDIGLGCSVAVLHSA